MKSIKVILVTLLLFSCTTSETPDYVIPHDDMVKVIVDIHLADGLINLRKVRRTIIREDTLDYYDIILKKYGYTRHDFDTSVFYYSKHINEYDEIYEKVLNKLNEMETNLQEENAADTKEENTK